MRPGGRQALSASCPAAVPSPAKVPVSVIDDLKSCERDGYVVLPQPQGLKRGDKVQVTHGPLNGSIAIFDGMRPHQRVAILLMMLGAQQRVDLPKADVRMVCDEQIASSGFSSRPA